MDGLLLSVKASWGVDSMCPCMPPRVGLHLSVSLQRAGLYLYAFFHKRAGLYCLYLPPEGRALSFWLSDHSSLSQPLLNPSHTRMFWNIWDISQWRLGYGTLPGPVKLSKGILHGLLSFGGFSWCVYGGDGNYSSLPWYTYLQTWLFS